MKLKKLLICLSIALPTSLLGQFHSLKIPQASPLVSETQRLGVTDISVSYSSPSVRSRSVWTDGTVPYEGDPIPWRAGANMNTRIQFSTDVLVENTPLKAGSYGLHMIPKKEGSWDILFANNDNQWGSYYVDMKKDIVATVSVDPVASHFSEQLDFEYLNRTDSSLVLAIEWEEKQIPINIQVDLNKTVVESFRYELRGLNTYQWEAWNDAADWCFAHNTNLTEALEWVNRSMSGGFNGFAANTNATNTMTQIRLLYKLDKKAALDSAIARSQELALSLNEAYNLCFLMLQLNRSNDAIKLCDRISEESGETWFMGLNKSIAYYQLGDVKNSKEELNSVASIIPEYFKKRYLEIIDEIDTGTYKMPPL